MKVTKGQEIFKLGDNRFRLAWNGVQDEELNLDFNPIINAYKLTGKYILLHWQAKPKNLRTWGIYDSETKTYCSVGSDEIVLPACQAKILDVPERVIKTVPTAVIMFQGVSCINGVIT